MSVQPPPPEAPRPRLAVIGGSGFYEFLERPRTIEVSTPYGDPSSRVAVGEVGATTVAFLPRHGARHELPPHRVNYRANLWALRSLGVRQIFAPCAVGSLQPELGPGALVIPDQVVDRTTGRVQTFMDSGAVHVGFADPYCPVLRKALAEADNTTVDGGTMVVIEGPRFATRAESQWYSAQGWSLVNMTGLPEAALARELAMCYAAVALVTDRDAGTSEAESVGQVEVFAEFGRNIERVKALLTKVVTTLPDRPGDCTCASALDSLELPFALP